MFVPVQCDANRLEQILRRLDKFNKAYRDEDNILDQIYESKYVRIISIMTLILYNILRKFILTQQITKAHFYEFLINMCCNSLNMHFLQSLLKFKIYIINILALHTVCFEYCLYPCMSYQSSPRRHFRIIGSHLIASHCTQINVSKISTLHTQKILFRAPQHPVSENIY